jgi:diguanylate cyclase (GGDEF)-like protein/PAS domain S-box-containing protein
VSSRTARVERGTRWSVLGGLAAPAADAAAEAVGDALVVTDREGTVLSWNASAEALFGWSAAEAEGQQLGELIGSTQSWPTDAEIRSAVLRGQVWRGELTCRRRNGEPIPVGVVDLPLEADGLVAGILSVIEDRTDRAVHERQRQALQALTDASTDAVVTVGGSTITSWNPAAAELFGWSADEVVGREVSVVVPEDLREECARMLTDLAAGTGVQQHETVRLHRDGTRIPVVVDMAAVLDPVSGGWLGVATVRDARGRDEALVAAREAERRIRALMRNSNEVVALTDAAGIVTGVSPSFAKRGSDPSVVLGQLGRSLIHPSDRPAVLDARRHVLEHPDERPVVLFRDHLGDGWRWREATFTNLLDDPTVRSVVLNIRDVHEVVEAVGAMQATEARLSAIVRRSSDVAMLLTGDGRIDWVSPAATNVFGVESTDLVGRRAWGLIHLDDRARVERRLGALGPGDHTRLEFRVRALDGATRWVEQVATNLLEDADVGYVVANLRDVTERHAASNLAALAARTDALTGLPNRTQLDALIEPHLEAGCGVVFFDIDDFCDVNDALGHSVGDELLTAVAHRVEHALDGRPETLVRFGGDQFAVVCPHPDPVLGCLALARDLHAAFATPFLALGNDVDAGISVGFAVTPAGDAETLVRQADTALYRAKKAGRGRTVAFDPRHGDRSEARMRYAAELRWAIERDEIRVHYQPLVELATNKVLAVEALARWDHPDLGRVPPDVFIPVAESTGLIVELGRLVMERACADAASWAARGFTPHLAVNASAVQLVDPRFATLVGEVLATAGLPARQLHIEITETTAMTDVGEAERTIEALRQLGASLSLDDFGTGYSSLSLLRRLPASALKIDRSFVDGLDDVADGDHDRQIVSGVVGIARALGLFVVAEGVETEAQADELRRLGCHFGQGFLWSPAVPDVELADVVRRIESRPA